MDCKQKQTTHAVIWLGIFVCEACANIHKSLFGAQQSYVKSVYGDHWDDLQLKSIQVGGNKVVFELLKEYGVENETALVKYKHACVKWY